MDRTTIQRSPREETLGAKLQDYVSRYGPTDHERDGFIRFEPVFTGGTGVADCSIQSPCVVSALPHLE